MDFHQNLHLFYTVSFTHSQKGSKNLKLFNFWLSLFNSMPLRLKAYSIFMLLRMWWKTAAGATTLNSSTHHLNHSCIVDLLLFFLFCFLQWRQKGFGRASCLTSSDVLYSDSFFFACRGLAWPQRATVKSSKNLLLLSKMPFSVRCLGHQTGQCYEKWSLFPLKCYIISVKCFLYRKGLL